MAIVNATAKDLQKLKGEQIANMLQAVSKAFLEGKLVQVSAPPKRP